MGPLRPIAYLTIFALLLALAPPVPPAFAQAGCKNDVLARPFPFQPVQSVYPIDPLYGNDLDPTSNPRVFLSFLDMVLGKSTVIFGGLSYDQRFKIGNQPNNQGELVISVLNYFTVPKEVTLDLFLTEGSGGRKRFPLGLATVTLPKGTPGNPCNIPSQTSFSVDAPLAPIFKFSTTSPYTLELEIVKPGGEAVDGFTVNNKTIVEGNTRDTKQKTVKFVPVRIAGWPPITANYVGVSSPFANFVRDTIRPWWESSWPLGGKRLKTTYHPTILEIGSDAGLPTIAQFLNATIGDQQNLWNYLFTKTVPSTWFASADRFVLLIDPQILQLNPLLASVFWCGLAYDVSGPYGKYKQAVLVSMNPTCAFNSSATHEVGHSYGLVDNYGPGGVPEGVPALGAWIFPDVGVAVDLSSPPYLDVMGTASGLLTSFFNDRWIHKDNYKSLLSRFASSRDPAVLGVVGSVNSLTDALDLDPWWRLAQGNVDLEWGSLDGDYRLEALDSSGAVLAQTRFDAAFELAEFAGVQEDGLFAFRVPWIDGAANFRIRKVSTGAVLGERQVSSTPPTVTITAPAANAAVPAGNVTVSWIGADADGDSLTYNVFIKRVGTEDWFPAAVGLTETSTVVDLSGADTGIYTFRVVATDGVLVSEAVSGSLFVGGIIQGDLACTPVSLNAGSAGQWVTCQFELPGAAASQIDTASILLNGVLSPEVVQELGSPAGTARLLLKLSRAAFIEELITPDTTSLSLLLTGSLTDSTPFQAEDTMRIQVSP